MEIVLTWGIIRKNVRLNAQYPTKIKDVFSSITNGGFRTDRT